MYIAVIKLIKIEHYLWWPLQKCQKSEKIVQICLHFNLISIFQMTFFSKRESLLQKKWNKIFWREFWKSILPKIVLHFNLTNFFIGKKILECNKRRKKSWFTIQHRSLFSKVNCLITFLASKNNTVRRAMLCVGVWMDSSLSPWSNFQLTFFLSMCEFHSDPRHLS